MESHVLRDIARLIARERLLIASAPGVTMDDSADTVAALVDVVRVLDGLDVAHAVGGGVAVGIRSGVPRATIDTDVAVRSDAERRPIVDALTQAGLRLTGTFAHSLTFRHASGEPVQIVFDPQFDPMIANGPSRWRWPARGSAWSPRPTSSP